MGFYNIDETSDQPRVEQLVIKDSSGTKQWQAVSVQPYGAVADGELLARSVEYPSRFENSGGLNDTLFLDAFTHGASAQRLVNGWEDHAEAVHNIFESKACNRRDGSDGRPSNPFFLYIGAVHMTAEELRTCKLNGEDTSRVRVYDAGDPLNELHAEIIVDARGLEKRQKKELRVRLMTLATRRGLFVSPYLSEQDRQVAIDTKCELDVQNKKL